MKTILLILTLALASCGGGSKRSPQPQPDGGAKSGLKPLRSTSNRRGKL